MSILVVAIGTAIIGVQVFGLVDRRRSVKRYRDLDRYRELDRAWKRHGGSF